jgi:hypothetical protein
VRLLLDTHVALWALSDPAALSPTARPAIHGAAEIYLSVVSPWEMVIKVALGKLVLHHSVDDICQELTPVLGGGRGDLLEGLGSPARVLQGRDDFQVSAVGRSHQTPEVSESEAGLF